MIDFVKSTEMKISLAPDQEGMLSTKETIKTIIRDNPDTVLAFDQNKHKGTVALKKFIDLMRIRYDAKVITTTYIYGNDHAKHIYEKMGFEETDVVDEQDCHEVNMAYYI